MSQEPNYESKNPFEVLGFTDPSKYHEITSKDIQKNYRRLISPYHPDKTIDKTKDMLAEEATAWIAKSHDVSQKLGAAKALLEDDKKRERLAKEYRPASSHSTYNTTGQSYNQESYSKKPHAWENKNSFYSDSFTDSFYEDYFHKKENKNEQPTGSSNSSQKDEFDWDKWSEDWSKTSAQKTREEVIERIKEAKAKGTRADLTDLHLSYTDLSHLDLENAIFSTGAKKAMLFDTNFTGSSLKGAGFDYVTMYDVKLDGEKIQGASFIGSKLSHTLKSEVISGADFTKAELWIEDFQNITFKNCNLSGANTDYSSFNNVKFENCDHTHTDYTKTKFTNTTFTEGKMQGTKFNSNQLNSECDFTKANREGILRGKSYTDQVSEAKFTKEGKASSSWVEKIKEGEITSSRSGKLAIVGAAVAVTLGAVAYGSWRDAEKQKKDAQQSSMGR